MYKQYENVQQYISKICDLKILTGQIFLNILVGAIPPYWPNVISSSSIGAPSIKNMVKYTKMKTTPPYFNVKTGNSHRLCTPKKIKISK